MSPHTKEPAAAATMAAVIARLDQAFQNVAANKGAPGPDRVDIPQVESTDVREPEVTGGYILKKDRLDGNDSSFTTPHGQELGLEWPHARELSTNQTLWIRGFINRFESALYGARYRDPVNGYAAFIDPDAFIDHRHGDMDADLAGMGLRRRRGLLRAGQRQARRGNEVCHGWSPFSGAIANDGRGVTVIGSGRGRARPYRA